MCQSLKSFIHIIIEKVMNSGEMCLDKTSSTKVGTDLQSMLVPFDLAKMCAKVDKFLNSNLLHAHNMHCALVIPCILCYYNSAKYCIICNCKLLSSTLMYRFYIEFPTDSPR